MASTGQGTVVFGNYEILDELARGGMGIIYRARQQGLNRTVALKMILHGRFAGPEILKRFDIEARAAARLQHPNIVAIHDIGFVDGLPYFTMDLVEGPNLEARLQEGPMRAKAAAELVRTIAGAVAYAHAQGVLHRDLKPSNILIPSSGEPRLTDFGLARQVDADSALTTTGQVFGSPNYIAPEQAIDASRATAASDIWSLGAILYHLLTGRPPFTASTVADTLRAVAEVEPTGPRLLNRSVPRDLETLCLKCLQKAPSRRYGSAGELADDLARFLQGNPISARPVGAWEKIWRRGRRHPATAALLGLSGILAIMVVGGAIFAGWRVAEAYTVAERTAYVRAMLLTDRALNANELGSARTFLESVDKSEVQRGMRDWEWRHLRERSRGDHLIILGRHDSHVAAVGFSPDDRWAASLGGEGTVKLWDIGKRIEETAWPAHARPERTRPNFSGMALAFSPAGSSLLTGGRDAVIRRWQIPSGRHLGDLDGLGATCSGIAFSSDGTRLAALAVNGEISVWSVQDDSIQLKSRWRQGDAMMTGLALSADGQTLAIGGYGSAVRFWSISDLSSPREVRVLEKTTRPVAISPGGQWIVAANGSNHGLRRWSWSGEELLPPWPDRSSGFLSLAFSRDEHRLAAGLTGGEIVIWNMLRQEADPIVLLGHEDYATCVVFSKDGDSLLSGSRDCTVRLWPAVKRERSRQIRNHGEFALASTFSPDSRMLASVSRESLVTGDGSVRIEHTLKLWRVETMEELASVGTGGGGYSAQAVFLPPDGHLIAVGSWKGGIRVYSVPELDLVAQWEGRLPCVARDGRSLIYRTDSQILERSLPLAAHAERVVGEIWNSGYAMGLSPDGQRVVGSVELQSGGQLQVWDVPSRRLVAKAMGHDNSIYAVKFAPNGRRIASAALDGVVILWDAADLRELCRMRAHTGDILALEFSPDGNRLATGGEDGVVRLWDTQSLLEVARLEVRAIVNSVAFAPSGEFLAAGASDGSIRQWQAPEGRVARKK